MTAIILLGLCTWLLSQIWKIQSAAQAITIGFIWLGLTVAFEFVFGRFIMKHPWKKLLNGYNILKGRVWVFVLAWVTLAPYVFYSIG